MKTLITGGRGFVGRHLTALLESVGHDVIGLDKDEPAGEDGQHRCDVRDLRCLTQMLEAVKPDAIVHLAAASSAGLSFKNPAETFEVNAQGTVNLLEAVRAAGLRPRLLIVSSAEVYGTSQTGGPVDEDSEIAPVNPYGLTKACAELAASHYRRVWELDVSVLRPFNHTGPGQTDVFVLPSFARQIAEAEAGLREPKLRVGNLNVVRDFSDVRDIADAYRLMLEKRPSRSVYNVCSGQGRLLGELLNQLISLCGIKMESEVDMGRWREAEIPVLVGDNRRIAEDLGWRPQIPLEKTLKDLLEYWREKVTRLGGEGRGVA